MMPEIFFSDIFKDKNVISKTRKVIIGLISKIDFLVNQNPQTYDYLPTRIFVTRWINIYDIEFIEKN